MDEYINSKMWDKFHAVKIDPVNVTCPNCRELWFKASNVGNPNIFKPIDIMISAGLINLDDAAFYSSAEIIFIFK